MASSATHGLRCNVAVSSDNTTFYTCGETTDVTFTESNSSITVTPHASGSAVVVDDSIYGVQSWSFTLNANEVASDSALGVLATACHAQTDIYIRFMEIVGAGNPMLSARGMVGQRSVRGPQSAQLTVQYDIKSRGAQLAAGTQS